MCKHALLLAPSSKARSCPAESKIVTVDADTYLWEIEAVIEKALAFQFRIPEQ